MMGMPFPPPRNETIVPQLPLKIALSAAAALTLAGSLAACSTPAGTTEDTATGAEDAAASDEPYTDGTYSANGSYDSPNGTESLDVTLTLEGDVVTDVEVVGNGDNPDSKRYQAEFIGGIADVVVGKDIDELAVDRVAGSSLSSNGFNAALEDIKSQAAA